VSILIDCKLTVCLGTQIVATAAAAAPRADHTGLNPTATPIFGLRTFGSLSHQLSQSVLVTLPAVPRMSERLTSSDARKSGGPSSSKAASKAGNKGKGKSKADEVVLEPKDSDSPVTSAPSASSLNSSTDDEEPESDKPRAKRTKAASSQNE
jgi:hypothetical protein